MTKYARKMTSKAENRAAIKAKHTRIVTDYKLGKGTPSGLPEKVSAAKSKKMAVEEWLAEAVAEEMVPFEDEWAGSEQRLRLFVQEQRGEWARTDGVNAEKQVRVQAKRDAELSVLREKKRAGLRTRLTIPADKWNAAMVVGGGRAPASCEHLVCKSWGGTWEWKENALHRSSVPVCHRRFGSPFGLCLSDSAHRLSSWH